MGKKILSTILIIIMSANMLIGCAPISYVQERVENAINNYQAETGVSSVIEEESELLVENIEENTEDSIEEESEADTEETIETDEADNSLFYWEENGYDNEIPIYDYIVEEVKEADNNDGKVLNIWSWSTATQDLFESAYPGYEKIDDQTGMIGEVTVCWHTVFSEYYTDELEMALSKNESVSEDECIDIFLVEDIWAQRFIEAGYTIPLADIGIGREDLSEQYGYTQSVVTDTQGRLCGFAYYAAPGVFCYRRSIAKEVFGTDEPTEIQEYLKDWGVFYNTAGRLKESGYYITQDESRVFRAFTDNRDLSWIMDEQFQYDEDILKWAFFTKELYEKEYLNETSVYDFEVPTNVFGQFSATWANQYLLPYTYEDGWGMCAAPDSFYYGGVWMCVAKGTQNESLIKEIFINLATDKELLYEIVKSDTFANNRTFMNEIALDDTYCSDLYDGQNPYKVYCYVADTVDERVVCKYEAECEQYFQEAMSYYFKGELTYAEAISYYEEKIKENYPEIH